MSGIDDKVRIGTSADFLEGVSVDTTAGTGLFREGIVVSDPETAGARQRIIDHHPAANDFGAVVRIAEYANVRDRFVTGELLAKQAAVSDQVLTFTFSSPVDVIYVFSKDHPNHFSNVDPFGGTPSSTAGIPIPPNTFQKFPIRATIIKVFEQTGGEATVWGYRY